jgi:hypothetical protein
LLLLSLLLELLDDALWKLGARGLSNSTKDPAVLNVKMQSASTLLSGSRRKLARNQSVDFFGGYSSGRFPRIEWNFIWLGRRSLVG